MFFPSKNIMKYPIAIRQLREKINVPPRKTIRIGFMLNDVIPSAASFTIFFRVYFDSPYLLGLTSKYTLHDLKPISGIIPLKNKFVSSNSAKVFNAFLDLFFCYSFYRFFCFLSFFWLFFFDTPPAHFLHHIIKQIR